MDDKADIWNEVRQVGRMIRALQLEVRRLVAEADRREMEARPEVREFYRMSPAQTGDLLELADLEQRLKRMAARYRPILIRTELDSAVFHIREVVSLVAYVKDVVKFEEIYSDPEDLPELGWENFKLN